MKKNIEIEKLPYCVQEGLECFKGLISDEEKQELVNLYYYSQKYTKDALIKKQQFYEKLLNYSLRAEPIADWVYTRLEPVLKEFDEKHQYFEDKLEENTLGGGLLYTGDLSKFLKMLELETIYSSQVSIHSLSKNIGYCEEESDNVPRFFFKDFIHACLNDVENLKKLTTTQIQEKLAYLKNEKALLEELLTESEKFLQKYGKKSSHCLSEMHMAERKFIWDYEYYNKKDYIAPKTKEFLEEFIDESVPDMMEAAMLCPPLLGPMAAIFLFMEFSIGTTITLLKDTLIEPSKAIKKIITEKKYLKQKEEFDLDELIEDFKKCLRIKLDLSNSSDEITNRIRALNRVIGACELHLKEEEFGLIKIPQHQRVFKMPSKKFSRALSHSKREDRWVMPKNLCLPHIFYKKEVAKTIDKEVKFWNKAPATFFSKVRYYNYNIETARKKKVISLEQEKETM